MRADPAAFSFATKTSYRPRFVAWRGWAVGKSVEYVPPAT